MKNIGKWLYLLGILLAIVFGLFGLLDAVWALLILLVLGILAAIFFIDSDDIVHFGIRFLILFAVKEAFGGIPLVGEYLTTIFTAVAAFLAPVVLTTLVIWFVKKYFLSKE